MPNQMPSATLYTDDVVAVSNGDSIVLELTNEADRLLTLPVSVLPDLIQFFESTLQSGRRRAFRVPVDGLDVNFTVSAESRILEGTPRDIGMIGIGLSSQETVSIGEEVSVLLQHEDVQITIRGIIKAVFNGTIGIFFPDCETDGEITPPEELRRLVSAVQIKYIRKIRASK